MISIIIPSYNRKNILPRAIESIRRQTYIDWEIIVVDDGSTDGTNELFKETYTDPRIKYIELSKNSGVHVARNTGLQIATGDHVSFLDSDDELFPETFSKIMKVFEQFPNVDMVSAPFQTDKGELTGFKMNENGFIDYKSLLCGNISLPIKVSFVVIKRRIAQKFSFKAPNLDFIFYRYVAREAVMYYLASLAGIYHLEGTGESLHIKRKIPDVSLSVIRSRELVKFISDFQDDLKKFCPQQLALYAYGAAVGSLLDGKKQMSMNYAWISFQNDLNLKSFMVFVLCFMPFAREILILVFNIKKKIIVFSRRKVK